MFDLVPLEFRCLYQSEAKTVLTPQLKSLIFIQDLYTACVESIGMIDSYFLYPGDVLRAGTESEDLLLYKRRTLQ